MTINNKAAWKSDLSKHIKSKHEGVKYPCKQCDYKATRRCHLSTHIASKHNGVKYPCDQCDYKASNQSNLASHINYRHEDLKYPCNQCVRTKQRTTPWVRYAANFLSTMFTSV